VTVTEAVGVAVWTAPVPVGVEGVRVAPAASVADWTAPEPVTVETVTVPEAVRVGAWIVPDPVTVVGLTVMSGDGAETGLIHSARAGKLLPRRAIGYPR
jgi:hypothetical protein